MKYVHPWEGRGSRPGPGASPGAGGSRPGPGLSRGPGPADLALGQTNRLSEDPRCSRAHSILSYLVHRFFF